jgi:hypothetical protein
MKSRAPKLRMGKHNMAKGALPPEELAVCVRSRGTFLSTAEEVPLGDETSCSTSKEYAKAAINLQGCIWPSIVRSIAPSSQKFEKYLTVNDTFRIQRRRRTQFNCMLRS